MRTTLRLCGAAIAIAAPLSAVHAERVFGLTGSRIVTFDSANPTTLTSSGAISGIADGDVLVGLDLRPATRTLYSLATNGNLYTITKDATGRGYTAGLVGTTTTSPSGASFGFDFNPMVDRLRVVSDTNQNLRINPNDPTLVGPPPGTIVDTPVTLNGSSNVDLVAAAYRNSRPGTLTTVLYGLDAASDSLVRATNANLGTYTNTSVLGNAFDPLGFSFGTTDRVAFDISGLTNDGFFTINNRFYQVDQISGRGSFVGNLGIEGITGITAGAVPEPATWAMMLGGFGLVGAALRRRSPKTVAA